MKLKLHLAMLVAAVLAAFARLFTQGRTVLANALVTEYPEGSKTYLSDAAISTRYRVLKIGTDENHTAVCGTGDIPIGWTPDSPTAAEKDHAVYLYGARDGTGQGVASGAIAAGDMLVPGASGAVRTLPVGSGTYYIIGRALFAAADGAAVAYVPTFPVQRVV